MYSIIKKDNRKKFLPFSGFDFDCFFDRFFSDFFDRRDTADYNRPACDLREDDNGYQLSVELAGFSEKEIDLSVEKNYLTVTAEKNEKNNGGATEIYRFNRQIRLPENIDIQQIDAKLKNGLLRVTIAKTEKKRESRLKIAVN